MSDKALSLTEQEMIKPRRKRRQRQVQVDQRAAGRGEGQSPRLLHSSPLLSALNQALPPETHYANEAMARHTFCGTVLVNALRVMHKTDNYMRRGVAKPYCKGLDFYLRIFFLDFW